MDCWKRVYKIRQMRYCKKRKKPGTLYIELYYWKGYL